MKRFGQSLLAATAAISFGQLSAQTTQILQGQFDQASRAFESENWRLAADLFSQLKQRTNLGARVAAVADIREGYARLKLGETQNGITLLERGLGSLPKDQNLASDRLLAVQSLASGYEHSNNVLLAAPYYNQQISLAPDLETRKAGYAGLARTIMFEQPRLGLQAARQLLAVSPTPSERAVALDLVGRAQLIAGQKAEAIDAFTNAIEATGGLTRRVDQTADSVRADLALAGLLSGKNDIAHKYLAATGTALDAGAFLPVPKEIGARRCPDGASPSDVAIVEFHVAPDGTVTDTRPIYASGGGEFAGLMAKYVQYFRWEPAQVAYLRPLQAGMARLEVHCFAENPAIERLYKEADPVVRWAQSPEIERYDVGSGRQAAKLAAARDELARRRQKDGPLSPQLMPVLEAIADSPLVGTLDTRDVIDREIEIAKAAKAPVAVLASLEARRTVAGNTDDGAIRAGLGSIASDRIFSSDAEAKAYLDLLIGAEFSRPGQPAEELRRAADSNALPPSNSVRRAANLRFSEYEFSDRIDRRKRIDAAAMGLNPCDAAQIRRLTEASSRAYPELTRRWGFEGWTFVQFDIGPDSVPRNVIPTISYPPFVFTPSAVQTAAKLRFSVSSAIVPDSGCTGYDTSVRFNLY